MTFRFWSRPKSPRYWNHNLHYEPMLVHAAPRDARSILDVGCGVGTMTRALRTRSQRVVGIDLDEPSISIARSSPIDGVEYIVGDFLTHPFAPASFDAVFSVATLHHVDAAAGLRRMRELARPGGVVGVVGLARNESALDFLVAVPGMAASLAHRITKAYWEHPSPKVWPPPESWRAMRSIAARELPGSHFRLRLLWRYSLLWTKPVGS